jgi:hypothetical protein
MRKSVAVSYELYLLRVLVLCLGRMAFLKRPVPGTRSECLLLDASSVYFARHLAEHYYRQGRALEYPSIAVDLAQSIGSEF